MLTVQNLTVRRADKDVLNDVSLSVGPGELVALTGPNGVGKSTLALTLLGHPSCQVVGGAMRLNDLDLSTLKIHERARAGLFLAHQEPPAIAGVSVGSALRAMCEATAETSFTTAEFYDRLRTALLRLGLASDFADRSLNEAFSGGEKKRAELLALIMRAPKYGILDEIDSGMDVEAKRLTLAVLTDLRAKGTGFLLISHNLDFVADAQTSQRIALV